MRRLLEAGIGLLLLTVGPAVSTSAQTDPTLPPALPSPSPSPDAVVAGSPAPDARDPRWRRVSVSGGPAAREDHTWTVDGDGRSAYLFGGRDGDQEFGDLWRFDLETDTWQRLSPRGRKPEPRFGHSAVWLEGQGLAVFAGQQDSDFFGDLWVFDPERERWTRLPARGAVPKPRYGSCMVVGRDGRLWISHGFTLDGRFDDTRAYNLRSGRWTSIAPDGRRPGQRCLHDCFVSSSGDLVLFGGQDDSHIALGDLWLKRSDGDWRPQPDPPASARRLYALAVTGTDAWIFGGTGADGRGLDDLWRVDRDSLDFERVTVPGAGPAARYAATLVSDAARGRLLLFGGQSTEARDDLWELRDAISEPVATDAGPPAVDASAGPSAVPAASPDSSGDSSPDSVPGSPAPAAG